MKTAGTEGSLARWILAQSRDGQERPAAAAAEAWERLGPRLSELFTSEGCEALGKRAVYLASEDFAFLLESGEAALLRRLPELLDGRDKEQAVAAAEAVYANLVGLLITFIGEDLALRAIQDVWPRAALPDRASHTTQLEAQR